MDVFVAADSKEAGSVALPTGAVIEQTEDVGQSFLNTVPAIFDSLFSRWGACPTSGVDLLHCLFWFENTQSSYSDISL